ncbi:MAG: DEAD/DEAH box helicase family protein, partial [Nanoarchaeota archaeon]|nr:DEAD/DEAH box helicase family protein [Nanoarchaeota archaeon]
MTWSLYQNDEFLKPLCFSNGKTQKDIVNEVLGLFEKGKKIVFISGVCGTGKSAIALNIARKIGKTSVVVPGKSLQAQYKKDYEEEKHLLKDNKEKLKISVITGRANHKCKFLQDNENAIPKIKKEVNSKLHDIFEDKREEIKNLISYDVSANNYLIPCKIELKEKNWNKIKRYLQQNKKVNLSSFSDMKDVKRFSVASLCPYWSPVISDKYELKNFPNAKKRKYLGLENTNFIFYSNKTGCSFYEQFNSYIDSDVLVFNALKYKLESSMNRKPSTEVEIIDECDEFLDSFSNSSSINLDYLQNSLSYIYPENDETEVFLNHLNELIKKIKRNQKISKAVFSKEIFELKQTEIFELLQFILDSQEIIQEFDPENYVHEIVSIARMFDEFFDETYVLIGKKENSLIINLVTTNLAKKFQEMIDKNKRIVLMSGTLHSSEVLKEVFGLEDFEIIEAETEQQGAIEIQKTGLEIDCKYSNFNSGKFSRGDYLKALDKCVEIAKKPVLVHINSFADLPTEQEKKDFCLNNLITKIEIKDLQKEDTVGKRVQDFKKGKIDLLFSTKCSRGVDFPGEECRSIVFTKYPNPNVEDAFWKILARTKPTQYWKFYKDKARRELLQKVYRGLRFKEDHVFLLSPDSRV